MIYGKLPVVLLNTMASEKNDSTNGCIASYILENINDVKNMGIKELATHCHVAMSSISRFCKDIGLEDYSELKEMLAENQFYFERQSLKETFDERLQDYQGHIVESLSMVQSSIDYQQILKLCHDLLSYKKVSVFGLLKAQSAAIHFQSDLLMLGKKIDTKMAYSQQLDYMMNASQDDLIIIFSYTGSYFDYPDIRKYQKKLYTPQIWMISSGDNLPDFVDETIHFSSLQNQAGHPYQLQFISSIIAQEYARLISD